MEPDPPASKKGRPKSSAPPKTPLAFFQEKVIQLKTEIIIMAISTFVNAVLQIVIYNYAPLNALAILLVYFVPYVLIFSMLLLGATDVTEGEPNVTLRIHEGSFVHKVGFAVAPLFYLSALATSIVLTAAGDGHGPGFFVLTCPILGAAFGAFAPPLRTPRHHLTPSAVRATDSFGCCRDVLQHLLWVGGDLHACLVALGKDLPPRRLQPLRDHATVSRASSPVAPTQRAALQRKRRETPH